MEGNHICKKCGGIAGWDSYFQSWICTRCGNEEPKPQTNADRIRAMTDEELADLFADNDCGYCRIHDLCFAKGCQIDCEDMWLDWLKQEYFDNKIGEPITIKACDVQLLDKVFPDGLI